MTIEKKIKKIIDKIRPFLESDGGDISFIKYEDGIVYVQLLGTCANCAMADNTLDDMVSYALTSEIKEVIKVVNVSAFV